MKLKLKATILSLVAVLLVAVVSIGGYCLWPAISATIKNEKYYTQQDVQNSYDSGYYDGCKNGEELTGQVEYYKILVDEFYNNVNTLNGEIATLNAQKKDYERKVAALTEQNESLESQVTVLSQTYAAQIEILNKRINELRASVNYYETYISTLENDSQAVATYEVAGTVWKIEIVNKGTELTLAKPANTEAEIYNGWKVNGELVGDTYVITANTKFVADVTYKCAVKFMVGDEVYNNQFVLKDEVAICPDQPVKDGYEFLGWSKNGVDVVDNIDSTAVTENVTYYAVFIRLHTVTFMADDEVVATQKVRNGNYASEIEFVTDGTLNGWAVDGEVINLSSYQILQDTIFVAKISRSFLTAKKWNGYSSIWGTGVWHIGDDYYYSYSTNQYKLDKSTNTWNPMTWNGLSNFSGYYIWNIGDTYYYSYDKTHYVLNKSTKTWSSVSWAGLESFNGCSIWNIGNDYYYSSSNKQYKLNIETHTWNPVTWNVQIDGSRIWKLDNTYYYFDNYYHIYALNIATLTWSQMGISSSVDYKDASFVFCEGKIYCCKTSSQTYYGSTISVMKVYRLDGNSWTEVYNQTLYVAIDAGCLWTDGVRYYFSCNSYQQICNFKVLGA